MQIEDLTVRRKEVDLFLSRGQEKQVYAVSTSAVSREVASGFIRPGCAGRQSSGRGWGGVHQQDKDEKDGTRMALDL